MTCIANGKSEGGGGKNGEGISAHSLSGSVPSPQPANLALSLFLRRLGRGRDGEEGRKGINVKWTSISGRDKEEEEEKRREGNHGIGFSFFSRTNKHKRGMDPLSRPWHFVIFSPIDIGSACEIDADEECAKQQGKEEKRRMHDIPDKICLSFSLCLLAFMVL